jgi:MOSC domain-containing protein YiiM
MGGIRPLPPENKPTGIFKSAVEQPVWLGREGLAGDAQADRRVHGGPEKALHQYPVSHYARLAQAFPEAAPLLVPGSIGENLSAPGWDETNVCIGDIFRLGDARVQVSQPRSPCWKIDGRYGVDGMAKLIADEGITGWYFRVLEEGSVEPGCRFEVVERLPGAAPVARLLDLMREHRPDIDALAMVATVPGLAAGWVAKLKERVERLSNL